MNDVRAGEFRSQLLRPAILAHLYYEDKAQGLLDTIASLDWTIPVVITTSNPSLAELARTSLPQNCESLVTPNVGRDIYPMLKAMETPTLQHSDVILKLQTKKSPWRVNHALPGDGDSWQDLLVDSCAKSNQRVFRILDLFLSRPTVQLAALGSSVLGCEYWGSNAAQTRLLAARLGVRLSNERLMFPAGSIYWCRTEILLRVASLGLREEDFDGAHEQDDGTLAHAIERLVGVLACANGHRIHRLE